jgi:hypothetical protein
MFGSKTRSFRSRLRAFQAMRGGTPDPAFVADLEFLENRDLDMSVRLGGLLAFDALMLTIGTHPISASPGSPISVDAVTQSGEVIVATIGLLPLLLSSFLSLKALLIGEDFEIDSGEDDQTLRQRLFAAFIRSIDAQARLLRHAVLCTYAGVIAIVLIWIWIIALKMP